MQQAALLAGAKLERSSDKGLEQRVSAVGTALELRMELFERNKMMEATQYESYFSS